MKSISDARGLLTVTSLWLTPNDADAAAADDDDDDVVDDYTICLFVATTTLRDQLRSGDGTWTWRRVVEWTAVNAHWPSDDHERPSSRLALHQPCPNAAPSEQLHGGAEKSHNDGCILTFQPPITHRITRFSPECSEINAKHENRKVWSVYLNSLCLVGDNLIKTSILATISRKLWQKLIWFATKYHMWCRQFKYS